DFRSHGQTIEPLSIDTLHRRPFARCSPLPSPLPLLLPLPSPRPSARPRTAMASVSAPLEVSTPTARSLSPSSRLQLDGSPLERAHAWQALPSTPAGATRTAASPSRPGRQRVMRCRPSATRASPGSSPHLLASPDRRGQTSCTPSSVLCQASTGWRAARTFTPTATFLLPTPTRRHRPSPSTMTTTVSGSICRS
ncbi:hypothetical protein BC831DRAFT_459251, partial [Entophlyctis helioformis]